MTPEQPILRYQAEYQTLVSQAYKDYHIFTHSKTKYWLSEYL